MSEHLANIVVNRKARHSYEIFDTFEAGLSLLGSEVKSLRGGRANLQEAYVRLDRDGNAELLGCHISPYEAANRNNHEPLRPRRLLLHNHELSKIRKATRERGMTIVPLRMYFKGSRVKLEIGLAKGKKSHDKRHDLKARDAKRDAQRGMQR